MYYYQTFTSMYLHHTYAHVQGGILKNVLHYSAYTVLQLRPGKQYSYIDMLSPVVCVCVGGGGAQCLPGAHLLAHAL